MNKSCVVLLLAAASFSCFAEGFLVRGEDRSCYSIGDLDRALSTESSRYFNGWEDADFDAAATWAESCVNSGWQFAGPTRVARLRNLQKKIRQTQARAAYAATAPQRQAEAAERKEADKREREVKQQEKERKRQELDGKRQLLDECKKTPTYSMYKIQDMVVADVANIKYAKDEQQTQRRYASASGVRDLYKERKAGEFLVEAQDSLKVDFAEYKHLGGKAASPSAIKNISPDPCAAIEAEVQTLQTGM